MDPYFAHVEYDIPRVKGYRVMHDGRGTLPPWAFGTDETVSNFKRRCSLVSGMSWIGRSPDFAARCKGFRENEYS